MARSLPVHTPATTRVVALVGNPNTGKSTIFAALTGMRQRIGNYPGITVEKRTGTVSDPERNLQLEILDLPGTYSLSVHADDEAVVLDALLGTHGMGPRPDVIVAVVDASNLRRNLFFTTQVLELGQPVVVALNMIDIAERAGMNIDVSALAKELGVPVVPIVASKGNGIDGLRDAIAQSTTSQPSSRCQSFPDCVCAELDGLCASLAASGDGESAVSSRAEAIQTLLSPGGYHESRLVERCGLGLAEELAERRDRISAAGESIVEVEAQVRYAWIDRVLPGVVSHVKRSHKSGSEIADRFLTHRVIGLIVFIVLMGGCFQSIYAWTTPLMNGIDATFGVLSDVISGIMPTGALRSLVVNGILAGIGSVLVFLPQILVLFFFLAILEDCGYMARAAFLLDRWMALLGLNGKSFFPLLSSFACAVPGILATRSIESRRDRMVTIMIAPLMSCSARLPVYALLIAAFVPPTQLLGGIISLQALTLLAMYSVGAIVAIPIALLLKKTILKGKPQSFLLELPTYKWPSPRTVFVRVYEQGREFCVTAGTIIFAVTVVIWALGYYPRPASIAADHQTQRDAITAQFHASTTASDMPTEQHDELHAAYEEQISHIDQSEAGAYLRQSILGRTGKFFEPIVRPLGWDWRVGTGVIAAFAAREVLVATLGTIYNLGDDQDETSAGLREQMKAATWEDGTPVFNLAVALSIMVFFALCCQCAATLAVIQRETQSWQWPVLAFTYMTGLAYVAALATYQITIRLT
jgi:ferrous iron transport protein B